MRKGQLEQMISTGKILGKRNRKTTGENTGQPDRVAWEKVLNKSDKKH
jgi:hypothetical protein